MGKRVKSSLPDPTNNFSKLFADLNAAGSESNTVPDYSSINSYVKTDNVPSEFLSTRSTEELNSTFSFSDQDYFRYKYQNQGIWDKIANSTIGGTVAGIGRIGENLGYVGSLIRQGFDPKHGVEGNFISNWFKENADYVNEELMPIYMDPDKKNITDQDWNVMFFKGMQSIIDSSIGFAGGGGIIMKGLSYLGKASKLSSIAAALGSIESESAIVNNFNKLMNTIATDANYQKAIHAGIGGLITNDIEGTAMAVQSYKESVAAMKQAKQEGRLDASWTDDKIEQFAADRAWDFKNTNRLLAIQDMFALRGIAKGVDSARGALQKSTWNKFIDPFTDMSTAKKAFTNNIGEMFEEMGQKGLEEEAKYQVGLITGDQKPTGENYFQRILKGATTKDAWYEGAMGFFGGGMQSMLTNVLDKGVLSKGYWEKQKERLKDQNDFLTQTASKIKNELQGLAGTQRSIEEHLKNGDNAAALVTQDMAFLKLASEHFRRGTTEHLERNIMSAMEDPNISPEDKKAYQSLLTKLATYENIYTKYSGYANQQELFDNEVTQNANEKLLAAYKEQQVSALEELRNGSTLKGNANWENIASNTEFWDPKKASKTISYFESVDPSIANSSEFQKFKAINQRVQEGEEYLQNLKKENEVLKSFKSNEFTKTKSAFLYNLVKEDKDKSTKEWLQESTDKLDLLSQTSKLDAKEKQNILDEIKHMHEMASFRKMFDLMEEKRKEAEKKVNDDAQKLNETAPEAGEKPAETGLTAEDIDWDKLYPPDNYSPEDSEEETPGVSTEKAEEGALDQKPQEEKFVNENKDTEEEQKATEDTSLENTPITEFVDNAPAQDVVIEVQEKITNEFDAEKLDEDTWGGKDSIGNQVIQASSDKEESNLGLVPKSTLENPSPTSIRVAGSWGPFKFTKISGGRVTTVDKFGRVSPEDSFDDGSSVQKAIDLMTSPDIVSDDFVLSLSTYGADNKQNIVIHHKDTNTRIGAISISNNPLLLEKLKNSPNNSLTTKMSGFFQALVEKPGDKFRPLANFNSDATIGVMTVGGLTYTDGKTDTVFDPTNTGNRTVGSLFMRVMTPRGPVILPLRYSTVGEVEGMQDFVKSLVNDAPDVTNTIVLAEQLSRFINIPVITSSARNYSKVLAAKGEELAKKGKVGSFLYTIKVGAVPSSLGIVTINEQGKITVRYTTKTDKGANFKNALAEADLSNLMTSAKSKSFNTKLNWNGTEITYGEYLKKIAKTNLNAVSVKRKDPSTKENVIKDVFHIIQRPYFTIDIEPGVTEKVEVEIKTKVSTNDPVQKVKEQLKRLNSKNFVVDPDDKNYYINKDNPSERYKRVSLLKGKFNGSEKEANRGTIVDSMLREFIQGGITTIEDMNRSYEEHPLKGETFKFSESFIKDLFEIFTEVKKVTKGLELISDIPTLWGNIDNDLYAGTIDLLGIDSTGRVFIIDLKTSTQNRRDEKGQYFEKFKKDDSIQQSAYAELLRQQTGITITNITLFPIEVAKRDNIYFMATANKSKNGKFTMQAEIDRNIFPELKKSVDEELGSSETKPTTNTTPKKSLPDEIFNRARINKELESLNPEGVLDSLSPYNADDSEESEVGNYLIGDLTYLQQVTILTDLINEMSSLIAESENLSENTITEKIIASYQAEIDKRQAILEEFEAFDIENFNEEGQARILSVIDDNRYAIEQLNTVIDNLDVLLEAAFDEIEDSDLFYVERGTEANQKQATDVKDPSFREERHFTVNPKLQISKELKIFLHGIEKIDANGDPYQNFLGKKSFMAFNDVFNTIKALLADEENVLENIVDVLTAASEVNPFLGQVVNKLLAADEQIQAQFVSQMPSHLLNMEYVSIRQNGDSYRVQVFDTNTNSKHNELEISWKENTHLAPLFNNIKGGDYPVNQEKLNRLKELLRAWRDETQSFGNENRSLNELLEIAPSNLYTSRTHPAGDEGMQFLIDSLNKSHPEFLSTGMTVVNTTRGPQVIRRLNVEGENKGNYTPRDYSNETVESKQNAKISIIDASLTSFNEETVKEFFDIIGVSLSKGTIREIATKGFINSFYNPKSNKRGTEYYTGQINIFGKTILNDIEDAISTLDGNSGLFRDSINLFGTNANLKRLVRQEVKYNKDISVNTFRSGEKAIYSYTAKKLITDRAKELLDVNEYNRLKSLPYNGTSLYLKYLHDPDYIGGSKEFIEAFGRVVHTDLSALKTNAGKGNNISGKINSLTEEELEAFMLGLFFNNSTERRASRVVGNTYRIAKYLYQTMSDKSTGIATVGLARVYEFEGDEDITKPSDAMIDDVYNWVFMPELKRLIAQIKAESSQDFKKDKYLSGAAQFLILPELNTIKLTIEDKEFTLLEYLNMDPDFVRTGEMNPNVIDAIKTYISGYITNKVEEKVEKYADTFIGEEGTQFVDTNILRSYGGYVVPRERLRRMFYEYETNALINYAENTKLYSGDPAMDYKGKVRRVESYAQDGKIYVKYVVDKFNAVKNENESIDATTYDFVDASERTFAEYTKRLAGLIAPGTRLANAVNNSYLQVYVNDPIKRSASEAYYKVLFKDDPKSLDAYLNISGADAQEFTTWQEHLFVLNGLGKVALSKLGISSQDLLDSKDILSAYKKGSKLSDNQKALLNRVFQPLKPVVTGFDYSESNRGVLRPLYIKTSSFPLLPYLTEGLEIDKFRIAMENLQEKTGKTVRASFNTGNKRGLRAKSLDLYADPNDITKIKDDLEITDDTYLEINRKNFRIQLEKPFKSEKKDDIDHIKRGTQPSKQLFADEVLTTNKPFEVDQLKSLFDYFGLPFQKDGKSLLNLYKRLFKEVYKQNRDNLFRELNIRINSAGKPIYDSLNLEKLSEFLQEELKTAGSTVRLQDKDALKINEAGAFNMDLSFSSNSNRYESALNALINNRVLKILMPGYSYNLGTEVGFNSTNPKGKYITESSKEYKGIQDRIIWTSKYNGESLQSANPKNGYKHQVIIPSKFRKEVEPGKWKIIDLVKDGFVKEVQKEDGTKVLILDEEKFDSSLLEIFGFRVPSSGMNTMASIEIAGFLPSGSGDLAIATADFVVKMGSDFDADSLYSYMYYHKMDEAGRLVVDGTNLTQENIDNRTQLDSKFLINSLIKIHHIVLTNPDENIQRNAARPLGFDFASESSKILSKMVNSNKGNTSFVSAFSTEYQKNQMIGAAAGKTGVGLFSLDVTSHVTFQQTSKPLMITKNSRVTLFGRTGDRLGRVMTLDGSRKISAVHEEYQNLALDSAKDLSIMYNLGVNEYTFSMFKAVNELGFDKVEVVVNGKKINLPIGALIANHPAVKAYLKELKFNDSSFNINNEDSFEVFKRNAGEFSNMSPKQLTETFTTLDAQTFVDDILLGESSDPRVGQNIVALFGHFDNLGKYISKIQGAFSVDSAMLDKSLFANLEDWSSYEELIDPDAKHLIENIVYLQDSIGGYAATYGLQLSTELYKKVFPVVHNSMVRNSLERIITVMGKSNKSSESKAKLKYYIYNEFKKFVYANSTIQNLGDTNLRTIRKVMFFDLFKDQQRVSKSLAQYIKELTQSGLLPLQLFNSLEYHINENDIDTTINEENGIDEADTNAIKKVEFNKTVRQPSTITLNVNTKGEKINSLYLLFNELLKDETTLPSWNGEEMTIQRLAQYLALYSFLEGGVQEATQFTSIIPVKYLLDFGIARNIQNFISTDSWTDNEAIESFVMQYFQHNPQRAPRLDPQAYEKRGSKFMNIDTENQNYEYGYRIIIDQEKDSIDNYPEYVKLVKSKNNRLNTSKKYSKVNIALYKRHIKEDGSIEYLLVPIKGVSGANEYTSNIGEDNNSLIFQNQKNVAAKIRPSIAYGTAKKVTDSLLRANNTDITVAGKNYKGVVVSKKDFLRILNEVKDPVLKRFISATINNADLDGINIYLVTSPEYIASAIPSENAMVFSRGLFGQSPIHIETALSEEYFHMLTANSIRANREYFDKVNNIRTRAITEFYNRYKKSFRDQNLSLSKFIEEVSTLNTKTVYGYVKSIMAAGTKKEQINKLSNILYSFSKVEEIAARGLVHKSTRDFLNGVKITDGERQGTKNESLFTALKNLIKSLFDRVFNLNGDSLLEDMITVMMEYQDSLFDPNSTVDSFKELMTNKLPVNPDDIFGSGTELEKFLYDVLGYSTSVNELIANDEITYTDEEGNLCAKSGFVTPRFREGGKWSIVKDLQGYPSHEKGGVDLTINNKGVTIKEGETEFVAEFGLVMPFCEKC